MTQSDFLKRLATLADLCGFVMTKEAVALYDRGLRHFGYPGLCQAVEEVIKTRRSRDPMPSIADIARLLKPVVEDVDLAIEAANRVVQAISKFGYPNPREAKAFVGEIGWYVVERNGGWENLCTNLLTKDVPAFKAQARELALSAIRRHRAGTLNLAPSFGDVALTPGQQRLQALSGQVGKRLTDGGHNGKEEAAGGTAGTLGQGDPGAVPQQRRGVVVTDQGRAAEPRALPRKPETDR